jgi:hypothetical protein
MDGTHFAPAFALALDGQPAPADLRASVQSMSCKTGYEGVDEVEITLANEGLRWLDNNPAPLGAGLTLALGYATEPLVQVFDGEVVARGASFPSGSAPTFTITAQDRRYRLSQGNRVRSFAIPVPFWGMVPFGDMLSAGFVGAEHLLLPTFDLVGAALSLVLGAVDVAASTDPASAQKIVRQQLNQSDLEFLKGIAAENGWDMLIEHDGSHAGHQLRFMSSLDHLSADFTFRYGLSMIDFSPRVSAVGQISTVVGYVWISAIKTAFMVSLGYDFDRKALTLAVFPSILAAVAGADGEYLIDEPLTLSSIPRRLVSELIPRLNSRLTASGSIVGEPRLRTGNVLRIEGVGEEFGGLYRATSITHTLDGSGFRTQFEARKEIWFGSIPAPEQGALPVRVSL